MSYDPELIALFLHQLTVDRSKGVSLSLLGLEAQRLVAVAHLARLAGIRCDDRFLQLTVCPAQVHFEVTASQQAFYRTFFPCIRQSWKQLDEAHVALEQQFGYTGCTTKVTVNLERWVSIPQIVECTVLQKVAEELVSMVTVLQACPLIELPTHTPTGCTIATMFEHDACCLGRV